MAIPNLTNAPVRSPAIGAAALFLLALALFAINLDRPPHPDELHHVLAAQHLFETGRPLLADGEYWRGLLHTWMVAASYEVFGDGLASARAPAVLLVALVVSILFLWVYREVGSLAAWLTGALLISSPFTVEIAQFSRFYALQMLFFVVGCICTYYSVVGNAPILRRLLLGVAAVALLLFAIQQQITTLMGVVGIAVWVSATVLLKLLSSKRLTRSTKTALLTGMVLCTFCVLAAVVFSDALDAILASYRQTPLFNASRKDEFWFYYVRFYLFYPTLWSMIGVFALFAVLRSPPIAWFAICVFGITFIAASFAGSKATRYMSFAPPFLAVLWGIGLSYIVPRLSQFGATALSNLGSSIALPRKLGRIASHALVTVALLILLLSNPFWLRSAALIGNVSLPFETPATNWRAARQALSMWVENADIMITTEELGAIYFLGRSDVRFSPSKLRELAPDQRKEFGIDHRTGRPVITTAESVEQLIACFQRGFIVGPVEDWGKPTLINGKLQAVIRRHANPISVPDNSHLYAWGWEQETATTKPAFCSDLNRISGHTSN